MDRIGLLRHLAGAALLAVAAATASSCSKPPGRETVVVYTSADQEYAEQIISEFHKQHPEILVLPRYDTEATKTTGLVERLRAEKSNPQADVYWSSEVFLTQKLADEGLLRSWTSDATTNWPRVFRDADGRWYGFAVRARVVAYDPQRVSQPPKYWEDLADPRYKSRIVMADPNYGTTRGQVATWFAVWGEQRATKFLEALKANDVRIVQGNAQAVRDLTSGLADLALADTDDVWAAQRNGASISLVYPRHGDGPAMGTLIIPNTVSLVAGRPASPSAELFAEFLLSDWCQNLLLQSNSHNIPVVPLDRLDEVNANPRYVVPDPLASDFAETARAMDSAMRAADRILLNRGG